MYDMTMLPEDALYLENKARFMLTVKMFGATMRT